MVLTSRRQLIIKASKLGLAFLPFGFLAKPKDGSFILDIVGQPNKDVSTADLQLKITAPMLAELEAQFKQNGRILSRDFSVGTFGFRWRYHFKDRESFELWDSYGKKYGVTSNIPMKFHRSITEVKS